MKEQVELATLLAGHCDPATTWWTAHDTVAASMKSGAMRKKRGVKAGLPDVQVLYRGKPIFIELKSRAGVASPSQKQVRLELLVVDATWWMARSARAAMQALHLSGVVFRRRWKPPRLQPWEGPFPDPTRRLPQAPDVAAQRCAARQRWRERQRHARETTQRARKPPSHGGETRGARDSGLEHMHVAAGIVRVTVGDETADLTAGDSCSCRPDTRTESRTPTRRPTR